MPQLVRRPIQLRYPNLEIRALQGDSLESVLVLLIVQLQDERDHSQLLRSLIVEYLCDPPIGSGLTPSNNEIQEVHDWLRNYLNEKFPSKKEELFIFK